MIDREVRMMFISEGYKNSPFFKYYLGNILIIFHHIAKFYYLNSNLLFILLNRRSQNIRGSIDKGKALAARPSSIFIL
jgi:hypothetical protein